MTLAPLDSLSPGNHPPLQPAPQRSYHLTRLSDVKPEPIRWLMEGRVPYGGLTILAGRPGEGKSQLTLNLASQLSHSSASILIGAEDGLADTVAPRILASRGNPENILSFDVRNERGFDDSPILPTDVPLIERAVRESGAALVVVDPFAAHLDPELNSMSDHSLRQATRPLARMARDTGCSVVIVAHLRKSREGGPLDWIGGSGGLTGAARSVLLMGRHKSGDVWSDVDRRYLHHVKSNGAKLARALACEMEEVFVENQGRQITTTRIVLGDEVTAQPGDIE